MSVVSRWHQEKNIKVRYRNLYRRVMRIFISFLDKEK